MNIIEQYRRTDDASDPLALAIASIERADGDITSIRLGELDAMDRAALDRAKNDLLAAAARVGDVLRATQPPVTYPHPGGM